jgi:hypothetical protein
MPFFVDLTNEPYRVVANDNTKATQNTVGINAAITDFAGHSAVLLLPYGDIYCERDTSFWSIRFAPGVSLSDAARDGHVRHDADPRRRRRS